MENDKRADLFCRTSFANFCTRMWPNYTITGFHREIIAHLEAIERGEIKRLIICMPPRHGKSITLSELFPAWYLGRNPTKDIIFSTYNQELADTFGHKVKNHILDETFGNIFPRCRMTKDSKSSRKFSLTAGGIYRAAGRGAGLTGRGANILILDDLLKDEKEASSANIRQGLKDWYRATASTRLSPDGAVVLNGTRWHEDDAIGFALKELPEENWTVLKYKAETDGKALWPERFSIERLMKIKSTLGPYFWNALFQQEPAPPEGNIIKRNWWRYYEELPKIMDMYIQSWDLAFADGQDSSFVVGQIWGKKGPNGYLIHQFRKQMAFNDTLKQFAIMSDSFPRAIKKLVENKANGPALISLMENKIPGITKIEPNGSKEARAMSASTLIESGNIYIPDPKQNPWVLDYIEEHATFPKGSHDDQVDATSQAINYLFGSSMGRFKALIQE